MAGSWRIIDMAGVGKLCDEPKHPPIKAKCPTCEKVFCQECDKGTAKECESCEHA